MENGGDPGSTPGRSISIHLKTRNFYTKYEKIFETLEKERANALEMAT